MNALSWTGTMADIWRGTLIPVTLVKGRDTLSKISKELQEPVVKKFLIAQEVVILMTNYYEVEAETMGKAIALIEFDPTLLPSDGDVEGIEIMGYEEADGQYDS
tara:strand:- start:2317 stop:2628 length:312 start_codon:yes stop_codon:yes gene_type:complete